MKTPDAIIAALDNYLNKNNMTDKPKKTRTPKNAESITKGALLLSLKDRVELVHKLKESISAEVETINEAAKQASTIANGLG